MSEDSRQMRLYVGNISEELYNDRAQLQSRFGKFGTLKGDLEMHKKPTAVTYFAYIDIEITPKEYTKLKAHLNGVNFKGSKLRIEEASATYTEKWEQDKQREDTKEEDRLKRDKIAAARADRIARAHQPGAPSSLVVKGRLRKSARKNLKTLTLRCYINGKLVAPKGRKTKVWGYDKNRKLRDLTWLFEHHTWKDGNAHVKEKYEPIREGISVYRGESAKTAVSDEIEVDSEEGEIFEIEKSTNNKILGDLFENFNFDKPVELEQDVGDESGESDYEFEASFGLRDSYDLKAKDCDDSTKAVEEYKRQNPLPDQDLASVSEEEDGTGLTEEQEKEEEQEQEEQKEQDVDDEFIPTFGKTEDKEVLNDTEKLRSLFNPATTSTGSSFKLQDSDVDEDQEIDVDAEEIQQQQAEKKQFLQQPAVAKIKTLFFNHFESPFLQQQTQLNKIAKDFNKEEYDVWFYEKRGELNREFKRQKRDFVRQFNKRK